MIAGRDDDVHLRTYPMQPNEIVGKGLFYRCRGLLDVKHITAYQQRIRLFFLAPAFQLTEEVAMLVSSVVILIDDLTQVQISCMQYLHSDVDI